MVREPPFRQTHPMRFLLSLSLLVSVSAYASDRYLDYLDLAKHEVEGASYQVLSLDRNASVAAIAIHGGRIEEGSDTLAELIAGADLNFYAFIAKKPANNRELHVTSTHFNDPRLLALATKSKIMISIHGFKEEEKDEICVGGGNVALRDLIATDLSALKLGISITTPCAQFGGSDARNPVNRSSLQGVQLELSGHLRKKLLADTALGENLAKNIRSSVFGFLRKTPK